MSRQEIKQESPSIIISPSTTLVTNQQISPVSNTSLQSNQTNHNNSLLTTSLTSILHSTSSSSSTSSDNLNQTSSSNNEKSQKKSTKTSSINSSPSMLISSPKQTISPLSKLDTSQTITNNQFDASNLNNKSISNISISISGSTESTLPQNSISLNYYNDHQVGNGHFFTKKTFHKPTYCHHCTEMLWGLIGQGFVCDVCNFVSHEKCQKSVVSPCSSIAHSLIKNPVPHCWSEPTHFKRKFCNFCRKRLDDQFAVRCEICEYYIHTDCQLSAVNDCCETATYVPNRNLNSVTHHHHWREGNLPSNSKCSICRKSCWTYECLAGMKCEWCGMTTHSICRTKVEVECNFGNLRDIIVPPHAVSVPRIDMNKETILGIPNRKCRLNSHDWTNTTEIKLTEHFSENSPHSQLTIQPTANKAVNNQTPNNINNNNSPNFNHENPINSMNNIHDDGSNLLSLNTAKNGSNSPTNNSNANPIMSPVSQAQNVATAVNSTNLSVQVIALPSSPSPTTSPSCLGNQHNSKTNNQNQNLNTNLNAATGSSKRKGNSKQEEEEEKETIKVYDGNSSFRKRMFKTITVCKNSSHTAIVEASLRTFHINDDTKSYYITVPLSASNKVCSYSSPSNCLDDYQIEELTVDESNPIKAIKTALFNSNNLDGLKPSVILRYKDSESESIPIYPGIIK